MRDIVQEAVDASNNERKARGSIDDIHILLKKESNDGRGCPFTIHAITSDGHREKEQMRNEEKADELFEELKEEYSLVEE